MALVNVEIMSIYKKSGQQVLLPATMARCTPDMQGSIQKVAVSLATHGGQLVLSDLFRSYDMQLQSYLDYKNGKKSAYSPPPGGSMHEAGRAMDLDLNSLRMSLADFWDIARDCGLTPIIATPNSGAKEAWHFDCRGSHDKVYQYYAAGKATNMKPYQAMAASAILAVGIKVDRFQGNEAAAAVQGALIRLDQDPGNIDGAIGTKTRTALNAVNVPFDEASTMLKALEVQLLQEFPGEFNPPSVNYFDDTAPGDVNV